MSDSVRITLDDAGLRRRLNAIPGAVDKALALTAVEVEDLIEQRAGRHAKTGALERSIFKRRIGGGWELGHDSQVAPHARFVHDGTRPHVILPKDRKVLRWPVPGRFAFARKVNHPGTKPDTWLVDAARLAPPAFQRHVETLVNGRT